MSVLIKGMEMPISCIRCPFLDYEDGSCLASGIEHESGGYEFLLCPGMQHSFATKDERHSNCPLVEIPPHGRLIDADALHEELYGLEYARENEWLDGVREARGVDAARVALLDAPTIIEAEEGE